MRRFSPPTRLLGAILIAGPQLAYGASELRFAPATLLPLLLAVLLIGWMLGRSSARRGNAILPAAMKSDQRLMWALWGSGDSFWIWEVDEDLLSWASADSMLGFRNQESIKGADWRHRVIHRDDRDRVNAAMDSHLSGGAEQYEVEYRLRDAAGQWNWVRARGRVVARDGAGKATLVAGTFRVIERERAQDAQRRISAEVIRHMLEGVSIVDLDFHFVSANPAFLRLTGYTAEELTGQSADLLNSARHPAAFFDEVRQELITRGHWSGEMWQRRRSGDEFLAWLQIAEVLSPEGSRSNFVAVLADVTDRKRAEQRLRYLAHFDQLTSLPNRAFLRQRLRQRIDSGGSRRFALMFMDLDRFKHVNDSLGHAAGDELLRQAARRLAHVVGNQENVARLGGDEFTVIATGDTSNEGVERLAGEILDAFAGPLLVGGQELAISPSIGIAYYPDHGRNMDELLRHADAAMYDAKARGRNTYRVYSARMAEDATERTRLEAALRKALDRDEIRLVYQPKLSLRSGRITGVEALLRWNSVDLGHVPPSRFIPLAEETGLILPLGEWALRQALSQARAWADAGMPQLRIAVNVSAVQLTRGGYSELVKMVLDGHGLAPGWLEIELTESALMADPKRTGATVAELREIGVRVAIDDFGTGYSSLSYLRGLAIDTVKIDKSFVDGIEHNVDDEVLTSTIVLMAHSLGLSVVAEGVETERQLTFLRGENCDEIQGYWLARPLEAEACRQFVSAYKMPKGLVLPGA
ncbi:MAG: EAL domain-containing protein [Rhodanobacteraceae bacterium]|nr:EAL domain-containing protein [Rhodanobacteraceae bacterium]